MDTAPLLLLVDDDSEYRDVVGTKLRAAGFRVEEAENGKDGVEKAIALSPALVIMDVKMPIMDGVEATRQILEKSKGKPISVLFLTAFGDPNPDIYDLDKRFAREVGAIDYFIKTEDLDKIAKKITDILARR